MTITPPPDLPHSSEKKFDAIAWSMYFQRLADWANSIGTLQWSTLNFTGSNITDIATRRHRDLQDLQGGTTAQYYHLNLDKYTAIVSPSEVRLKTANGYGSTNTCIRRFTTSLLNTGSSITYADSATNGASFTINANGVYAITFSDNYDALSHMGISLNSSELTTAIYLINTSDILVMTACTTAHRERCVAWTGYLQTNDVIRAHTDGSPSGTEPTGLFTIVRLT